MTDPIRAAAYRLLQRLTLPSGTPYAGQLLEQAESELRTALAAAPSAPDPHEALAVRPLLEAVAALEVYKGRLPALQQRISAWLVENPPGQPVAIEPRGCPAPGACSCVEPSAPDHLRGATEMAAHSARLRQCPTHGQQPAHTWGCPECLRELREELARVKATAADGYREGERIFLPGADLSGSKLRGTEWRPCVKLPITVHVRDQHHHETHLSTREGITPVRPDDLIMRGVQGEEYPIGRDLFNKTYRLGTADPTDSAPAPAPEAGAALSLAAIIRSVDGSHSLGAAALADAIFSHPAAASVFQPPAPDHIPGATEMVPAIDGEREELADRLGWIAAQLADIGWGDDSASVARAAALLRELPPPDLVPLAYDAGDGVQILRITSEDGSWSVRNSRHVSPITGFSTAAAAWAALQQARRQAAAVAEDFRRQILAAAAALQDHPPGPQPGDSVFFSGGEVFCVNRIGADSCWPSLARPEEPPQGGEVEA